MVSTGLTKDQLDYEFTAIYAVLEDFATNTIRYTKRNIDLYVVINECYLYLHSKMENLFCKEDVVAYAKTWIRNNLLWTNSPLLRQELPKKNQLEALDHIIPSQLNYSGQHVDVIKMQDMFYMTLSSYDKRLFNIYFNLNKQTGKDVAKYLDISVSSAYNLIKECKVIEQKYVHFIKRQSAFL